MADQPIRVVVEVATPEAMARLQEEFAALQDKFQLLQAQHNALHATVYRLMDRFADLTRSVKDQG